MYSTSIYLGPKVPIYGLPSGQSIPTVGVHGPFGQGLKGSAKSALACADPTNSLTCDRTPEVDVRWNTPIIDIKGMMIRAADGNKSPTC